MVVMYQRMITHGHHALQPVISALMSYKKAHMMMVRHLMSMLIQVPAAVNGVGQLCHHTPPPSTPGNACVGAVLRRVAYPRVPITAPWRIPLALNSTLVWKMTSGRYQLNMNHPYPLLLGGSPTDRLVDCLSIFVALTAQPDANCLASPLPSCVQPLTFRDSPFAKDTTMADAE